jgi:hypothetical protein
MIFDRNVISLARTDAGGWRAKNIISDQLAVQLFTRHNDQKQWIAELRNTYRYLHIRSSAKWKQQER